MKEEASKISCHSWTKFSSLFGRRIPELQPVYAFYSVLPASDRVKGVRGKDGNESDEKDSGRQTELFETSRYLFDSEV